MINTRRGMLGSFPLEWCDAQGPGPCRGPRSSPRCYPIEGSEVPVPTGRRHGAERLGEVAGRHAPAPVRGARTGASGATPSPSSGSTSWLEGRSGIAAWTGRCSRSPVISRSPRRSRTRTLRCPGVCPGVCRRATAGDDLWSVPFRRSIPRSSRTCIRCRAVYSSVSSRCGEVRPVARMHVVQRVRRTAAPHRGPRRRRGRLCRCVSTTCATSAVSTPAHASLVVRVPRPVGRNGPSPLSTTTTPAGVRRTNAWTCQGHAALVHERPRMALAFCGPVDLRARAALPRGRSARTPRRSS